MLDHGLAGRIMFADFFQDLGHFLMETFGRMPLPTKAAMCRVIIQGAGNVEVQNLGHGTTVDAAFFGIRRCGRKWGRSRSKIVGLGEKANNPGRRRFELFLGHENAKVVFIDQSLGRNMVEPDTQDFGISLGTSDALEEIEKGLFRWTFRVLGEEFVVGCSSILIEPKELDHISVLLLKHWKVRAFDQSDTLGIRRVRHDLPSVASVGKFERRMNKVSVWKSIQPPFHSHMVEITAGNVELELQAGVLLELLDLWDLGRAREAAHEQMLAVLGSLSFKDKRSVVNSRKLLAMAWLEVCLRCHVDTVVDLGVSAAALVRNVKSTTHD